MNTPTQIEEVTNYLGTSRPEIARVFGVTPLTLYSWSRGDTVPDRWAIDRIHQVTNSLAKLRDSKTEPLLGSVVRETRISGKNLIDVLASEAIDNRIAKDLISNIRATMREHEIDHERASCPSNFPARP
jgi:hypothetical protein